MGLRALHPLTSSTGLNEATSRDIIYPSDRHCQKSRVKCLMKIDFVKVSSVLESTGTTSNTRAIRQGTYNSLG